MRNYKKILENHRKHRYELEEESEKQVNRIFRNEILGIKLWTVKEDKLMNSKQD